MHTRSPRPSAVAPCPASQRAKPPTRCAVRWQLRRAGTANSRAPCAHSHNSVRHHDKLAAAACTNKNNCHDCERSYSSSKLSAKVSAPSGRAW
eukprot:scaffold7121_cov161-Prasinococcus_capsulatus_cf.AAC.2